MPATPHTEGGKKEGIYHGAELHVTNLHKKKDFYASSIKKRFFRGKIRRNRESEKRSAVITQYQHHQRAKHYTGNDVKTEV